MVIIIIIVKMMVEVLMVIMIVVPIVIIVFTVLMGENGGDEGMPASYKIITLKKVKVKIISNGQQSEKASHQLSSEWTVAFLKL